MQASSSAPARANLPLNVSPPPRISSRPLRTASCVRRGKPAGTGCHCIAKSWNQMLTAPRRIAPSANGNALGFMEGPQELNQGVAECTPVRGDETRGPNAAVLCPQCVAARADGGGGGLRRVVSLRPDRARQFAAVVLASRQVA